jgi:hypothetical protein
MSVREIAGTEQISGPGAFEWILFCDACGCHVYRGWEDEHEKCCPAKFVQGKKNPRYYFIEDGVAVPERGEGTD